MTPSESMELSHFVPSQQLSPVPDESYWFSLGICYITEFRCDGLL